MDAAPAAADVEVSIVSLKGGEQLAQCIAALPRACAGLSWRLTLVDNSPAGLDLTQCLGAGGPAASVVLRSTGRRGFGANQNLALAAIVGERRARYTLILNDDAVPDELSVTTMVRYADDRPHSGAISPVIRGADGALEPSIVAWPTLTNVATSCAFPSPRGRAGLKGGWINGACMLVRTEALAHVGLFDPRYFLYYEETDLCRRMSQAGWQLERCDDAAIVHHRHQTAMLAGSALEIDQQVLRSGYLYFRKHHGPLAARAFNWLVRCGLLARTAKVALGHGAGNGTSDVPSARRLWTLAMFRPSRPTRFEVEARANSERALPEGRLGRPTLAP